MLFSFVRILSTRKVSLSRGMVVILQHPALPKSISKVVAPVVGGGYMQV